MEPSSRSSSTIALGEGASQCPIAVEHASNKEIVVGAFSNSRGGGGFYSAKLMTRHVRNQLLLNLNPLSTFPLPFFAILVLKLTKSAKLYERVKIIQHYSRRSLTVSACFRATSFTSSSLIVFLPACLRRIQSISAFGVEAAFHLLWQRRACRQTRSMHSEK
jgi:hypothetical protein